MENSHVTSGFPQLLGNMTPCSIPSIFLLWFVVCVAKIELSELFTMQYMLWQTKTTLA